MASATCCVCNVEFDEEGPLRLHYRSEWHLHNLELKAAGVPAVTQALFLARPAVAAQGRNQSTTTRMLYSCAVCNKEYASKRLHGKHLKSRAHAKRASQEASILDPLCCFMCDLKHVTTEDCMIHMHKKHGFFIPDSEYLEDPRGLLLYVRLKVARYFMCLYCNERCRPFQSLEAVRKHMDAKGHCKLRYGDLFEDDQDGELEDFYDYSSSYVDVEGKQLVAVDDMSNRIDLGVGGYELVITNKTEKETRIKALGYREFLRYYRQKPRPSDERDRALAFLASRRKSILMTKPEEHTVRMGVLRAMNKMGVEAMRTMIGMKSNLIRNLRKNVPYEKRAGACRRKI